MNLGSRVITKHIHETISDGRRVRVTDIASSGIFGTLPTVRAHVAELERLGWVECLTDPDDARAKSIYLTSRALRALQEMSLEVEKFVSKHVAPNHTG